MAVTQIYFGSMSKRSGGSYRPHYGWNKWQMRDGQIVLMNKDGSEKQRYDKETKEPIEPKK